MLVSFFGGREREKEIMNESLAYIQEAPVPVTARPEVVGLWPVDCWD
jgi:hypothetical protein